MSDVDRSSARRTPLAALGSPALVQRREALIARSAVLRERMARDAAPLAASFEHADRVIDAWRWLRAHPVVSAVGAAIIALWKPRQAWRWTARAWTVWRGWLRLRRLVSPARASSARVPAP